VTKVAAPPLMHVYRGWEGYQTSLVHAIAPLSPEQLAHRSAPYLRSVGEIARHISGGRITWFHRMPAPGSAELVRHVPAWEGDEYGNRYVMEEALIADPTDAAALVRWLEATWQMIEATLTQWTVDDLEPTFRHTYFGKTYAISRQWVIWRIMAHDIHHGGQLSELMMMQGIDLPELGDQGGHVTEVPLADAS
jgi:uncharacterized damage-inducible protein DinB